MKIFIIFTFYLISGSVRCFDVTGYSGGSVLVNSWKLWCDNCFKYMAKHDPYRTIIQDKKHDQWITEGRFTLFHNKYGNLMIFIRELKTTDAGRYQIGFNRQWFIYMTLNVIGDSCCGRSKTVTVNSGETAEFSCEYSQNHKNNWKAIFKEGKTSIEEIYSTWKKKERFSISDERYKNLFSVRITAVTPDDGGVYLCGVWDYNNSYSLVNTVHLHIINKVGSYRVTGYSGGQIIIKCEHPQYKTNPKYICKESDGCSERKYPGVENKWMENGDVSLYDDTRGGVLMVFFRDLNAGDAGTYRCGVNVSQYTDRVTQVTLDVKEDALLVQRVSKSVYLGEEVKIFCQIPEEHEVSSTHFCKEDDDHICQTVNTSEETQMNSLSERNEARVFTVRISNLTVRDAGVYWCGTETSEEHLTFISLTTEVHLNLINKVGSYRVTGYSGGQIIIKCEHPQYKTNPKYICKESDGCSERKYPGVENKWMENGDVSLYDDTRGGVLMVFFRDLNAGDAGTYRCGVNVSQYTEWFTEVKLDVKNVPPVFGHEGESVEIICPYDPIYKSKSKYLCKGKCSTRDRNPLIETVRDQNETKTDRLTLNDDITASVFTVTITGLTAEDAGKYCCAMTLERDVNYLYTHLIIIRKQELILNQSEGDDISIKCKHHDEHQNFFCKGHQASMCVKDGDSLERIRDDGFSLSDEASTGVFTVNITDLRQEDSGIYWCGSDVITKVILNIRRDFSMIIIICVCVNLLLIGGFTLILCKLRHNKRQEITSTSDKRKRDTNRTFPSNSSDGLLYAAVSFHKHEDSLTDDTVTFSKEEIHTDYATIRYCTRLN
ncbi:polymeric immunoglobulin receptor-like [Myxocyprinus asiaticus]|uniref:polymeric immunoglobulin receptor-like n=1 Tax=Myxocyprinus asiaticus TaxID=70543 RepID=UPI002223099D|nr:polymeric immunoglobulin receptor-like [Myxocyprinus asiaticus]